MVTTTRKATVDLWRGFRPTASQERFLRSTAYGRLFSSGYGSGKSMTGCRESIRWAATHAGSRNLVGRQTATELRDTTMVTFWKQLEVCGFRKGQHYEYNAQDKQITWWNGSVTIFRHLDSVDAMGSLELSSAFIDEGAEVADDIYITLTGSRLRWHIPGCDQEDQVRDAIERGATPDEIKAIPCRCPRGIWVCTNPGASGYLEKVVLGRVPDWEWIKATPGDNPYNPPDYYDKMERNRSIHGDVWMRKYYDGEWGTFEGQRFSMFDHATHVLPSPFRPDGRYEIIEGWDFGHRETFVVWIAYEPRQEEPVVMFHELQVQEVMTPEDVADRVKRIRADYGIVGRVQALGDPAGAAASQFSAIGPIMAYANLGISIAPCRAGKSPIARADLMAHWFTIRRRQYDGAWWPGLVIGPNCPALIHSITNLRWDQRSSREQFVKDDDHGFDAAGYGLIGVPPPSDAPSTALRPGVNRSVRPDDILRPDDGDGWVDAA